MGGATDFDGGAVAVGVDAVGEGRAGIQGQVLLDPGGALQGSTFRVPATRSCPTVPLPL
ncbi:hypothetical protein QNM99_00575 [Pseudomonas sp. PCH446]